MRINMKINMKKCMSLVCLMATGALFADTTPVMVSLVAPVQVPSYRYDVTGFRLSLIYGDCQNFVGLDIGIVGNARKDFTGLAIGGVNIVGDRFYGGQLGLINWNSNDDLPWERRSIGAQLGLLNYADTFCGLQESLVNISGGKFTGLQTGFISCANDLYGLQCGFYFLLGVNVVSGAMRGCQIGLVNYAQRIDGGLQIGLVNVAPQNGWLPVLPIVNGHF